MLKLLSVFLSASTLFIISALMGDEQKVNVRASAPEQVLPGSEFVIRLTIQKGNTLGFARIQQFLPEGFDAEELESGNAQFIEDGNSVKFIWMQMPMEDSFEISYKVKVRDEISGLQAINGVLIYIEDEKTEQYALPPIEVLVSAEASAQQSRPQVQRKLTATVPELNEYKVELSITPGNEERSAKFIDQIPEGYDAFPDQSHGAHFLFSNGTVSFTWAQMPPDSTFSISYLVRSTQRRTPPSINGMLVYGNSATDLQLDSVDKNDALYEQALKNTEDNADQILNELLASENSKKQSASTGNQIVKTDINLPTAKGGIYYKVQIAATIKSPVRNNDWFRKHYKLNEEVDLTYHEGWKKYLIGSFDNYKAANSQKKVTREKVSDAFVVAYQDGQRITLKEAMAAQASNQ